MCTYMWTQQINIMFETTHLVQYMYTRPHTSHPCDLGSQSQL